MKPAFRIALTCDQCGRWAKKLIATAKRLTNNRPNVYCEECIKGEADLAPICDFCGQKPVTWTYPAETHMDPRYTNKTQNGEWGACTPCHEFIEADKWDALSRRAALFMGSDEEEYAGLRAVHAKFREYRTGPGYEGWTHEQTPKEETS